LTAGKLRASIVPATVLVQIDRPGSCRSGSLPSLPAWTVTIAGLDVGLIGSQPALGSGAIAFGLPWYVAALQYRERHSLGRRRRL
jgi:hypothetical protein